MIDPTELQAFLCTQRDVRRLRYVLKLADGFHIYIVTCPAPVYAEALTDWLSHELTQDHQPSRHLVVRPAQPGHPIEQQDIIRDLFEPLVERSEPYTPRVWFLDLSFAQANERQAWRWMCHRFNERRGGLMVFLKAPMILLMPPWLLPVLATEAQDFWSGRGTVIDLEERFAEHGVR